MDSNNHNFCWIYLLKEINVDKTVLFQNGRVDERRFQSTPEERLSIVGGKRAPQFYLPSYEAEIAENQKKDSE